MANIGLVCMAFARGQSYVSLNLARALEALGHQTYWLVREGGVYGQPMRETTGVWALPNRTDYPTYEIPPQALVAWATFHGLQAIVFNEELTFDGIYAVQQAGIRTIEYIDAYIGPHWRPFLRWLDGIWCVTHRAEAIMHAWRQESRTHWIGWGVPSDMFAAPETCDDVQRPYGLFSSQGWLGVDCRKGLDQLLAALDLLASPPSTLIHAQVPIDLALQMTQRPALPANVTWMADDVPPPGPYHLGRVCVQPSKHEGFGLSVIESMCAGRPMIVPDAAPMAQFVDEASGWLVPVERWQPHPDGSIYQQALVNPAVLAKTIEEACGASDAVIREKSRATLQRARTLFDWEAFKARLAQGLAKVGIRD